jgi:flagella basal body P-ring formation protein FlgA
MKKTILLLLFCLIIIACSSVKSTQEAINKGNYDKAIDLSLKKLTSNKNKEKYQPYVFMLQEAFNKVSQRELSKIDFLRKEENPENLERIYNLYLSLHHRQERIKPLLPLKNLSKGRNAVFNFNDYNNDIINAKNNFSEYLYMKSKSVFSSKNKEDYRRVYEDLEYLDKINPNYKDVRQLQQEAHNIGTDFVLVSLENKTDKVIPKRLEKDLLNFDTYGLNDFWTIYHSKKSSRINYDFTLKLVFRDIRISPEQVHEKEIIREKRIKDGFKYLLDSNGNQVKDSLGNKIKVDKFISANCHFYQFTQSKSAQVIGMVQYFDNFSKQRIQNFPLESEFIFEHRYATYRGDKRALERSYLDLLSLRAVTFPSNEQMVYDVGRDVKEKLKYIITRNKFRK